MTDEKVVQLAEQVRECFRNVPPSVDLACTVVTYQDEIVKCALEAAYALGRRDGLEEAAKIAFGRGEKYQKQLDNCGSSHELEYDDCDLTSMQANEAWAIAATIRQLTDAASISSSANSVEGKKE